MKSQPNVFYQTSVHNLKEHKKKTMKYKEVDEDFWDSYLTSYLEEVQRPLN